MRFGQYIVLAGAMTFVAACKPSPDPTPSPEPQATEVAPAATSAVEATSSAPAGGGLNENSRSLHGNVQDLHMQVNLAADAMFDFDSAVLKATAAPELQKAADAIRSKGKGTVLIVGHTDAKGNDAYNRKLSLDRANAVKDWLVANGVEQTYNVSGEGASKPIAPNANADGSDNPEGRAKNRRVEININSTKTLAE